MTMRKKDTKKQKAARRKLSADEQRQIFEQGVQLGLRIAEEQSKQGYSYIKGLKII